LHALLLNSLYNKHNDKAITETNLPPIGDVDASLSEYLIFLNHKLYIRSFTIPQSNHMLYLRSFTTSQ